MSLNPSKTLVALMALLIVTGCSDRTRYTCEQAPTATRCDTSTEGTTP